MQKNTSSQPSPPPPHLGEGTTWEESRPFICVLNSSTQSGTDGCVCDPKNNIPLVKQKLSEKLFDTYTYTPLLASSAGRSGGVIKFINII